MKLKVLEAQNSDNGLLLLTKSKNAYLCDIKTKNKRKKAVDPFLNDLHTQYCIHTDIGFNDARNIGYDVNDVHIINNKILFGVSDNKINTLCLNTGAFMDFMGDISLKQYYCVFTQSDGLLLVGGKDKNDNSGNENIWKVQFDAENYENIWNIEFDAEDYGVNQTHSTLGEIELFDPRDRTNKWIYVDTVANYFKLPNDSCAGTNCFLPL